MEAADRHGAVARALTAGALPSRVIIRAWNDTDFPAVQRLYALSPLGDAGQGRETVRARGWPGSCDSPGMEKFLVVMLALFSLSGFAAEERGHRVVASLDRLTLAEHPEDDGNLRLLLDDGKGGKIQNDLLVGALDRDADDVKSYGVGVSRGASGGMVISSVKKWGATNFEFRYLIRDTAVSNFDYSFMKRDKHTGSCSLDLETGKAVVNGRAKRFSPPETALSRADGLELQSICERLGAN